MKTDVIYLTVALSTALSVFAQDDVSSIFDDLVDFEPTPAVSQSEVKPTISMPRVAPPKTLLPMPVTQTEFVYSAQPEDPQTILNSEETRFVEKEVQSVTDVKDEQKRSDAVLESKPENKDADCLLRRIAQPKNSQGKKNHKNTRTRMLGDVRASWNTQKPDGELLEGCAETVYEPTQNERRATALREKLESIQISTIAFQNADIQQVVLELSALCRKLDPERTGANLVVLGTSETLIPSVTFSGTDLSALETLDIITQISGMKYTISSSMVSLTPVNYEPPQQMVSAEFDVLASVGNKMVLMINKEEGGYGLLDVRGFFSTVPFPPAASAQYNPEFNLLLVRNVPKHIKKVEALLGRYNQKALEERSQQVEIETKFIEVSEGALEELGFDWTVGRAGENLNNDTVVIPGGQKIFTDTLRSGATALSTSVNPARRATAFNALARSVVDPTYDGLAGATGELLVQKIRGDIPIDIYIRALERSAGSDLLSAPKILTKSGETASIHVGETHWFPTAYDVEIERYAQPSLIPLDYEKEKTGVMLEVTPDLDSENGTIDLKLSSEIRELAGFSEQHVATVWPDFGEEDINLGGSVALGLDALDFLTVREENRTINADRLIARRPIIKTRKLETTVTIETGSTIAMGGLIKEKLETFKDSVPILGKIPLLGRLFRSEGERSVKRNLMIFVTANQVDASGHKKSGLE